MVEALHHNCSNPPTLGFLVAVPARRSGNGSPSHMPCSGLLRQVRIMGRQEDGVPPLVRTDYLCPELRLRNAPHGMIEVGTVSRPARDP